MSGECFLCPDDPTLSHDWDTKQSLMAWFLLILSQERAVARVSFVCPQTYQTSDVVGEVRKINRSKPPGSWIIYFGLLNTGWWWLIIMIIRMLDYDHQASLAALSSLWSEPSLTMYGDKYSSMGGHVHTRFLSPKLSSILPTLGHNLASDLQTIININ